MRTIYCIQAGEYSISKHFRANEFRCKDGSNEILVCQELIDILEEVREHFNAPVNVRSHSGYRTPDWNKKVNGAKNSYHCKGMAADFHVKGHTTKEIAEYLNSIMKTGGIIRYTNFVHVDVREYKYRKGV